MSIPVETLIVPFTDVLKLSKPDRCDQKPEIVKLEPNFMQRLEELRSKMKGEYFKTRHVKKKVIYKSISKVLDHIRVLDRRWAKDPRREDVFGEHIEHYIKNLIDLRERLEYAFKLTKNKKYEVKFEGTADVVKLLVELCRSPQR